MRETLFANKPLIIVIVAALGIIGALLVYGILVTPARQPYRDALVQLENVDAALVRTNVSVSPNDASDEDFAKNIEAAKASFASLEAENEALGKEEALQDGEGKTLYDAYDKDLTAFIAYNNDVLDSMKVVRPVFYACSAEMDSVEADAEGASVMQECADTMAEVSDVPDAEYQALATSFQGLYAKLAAILLQMAAAPDKKGSEYAQLSSQRDAVVQDFSAASTTFSEDVQKRRTALLTTDSSQELNSYLTEKSRIF